MGPVELAFTDRFDGVSTGPWSSLNLGTSNGDDPADVQRNLSLACDAFDVRPAALLRMSQFHGAEVFVADERTDMCCGVPIADAMVTATPGVALLARVADCAPIVLADPVSRVVGVVHAGRRGMVRGVVPAAVSAMRDLGAKEITGWVGPRACGGCYEVPEQMQTDVCATVPRARATTSWGTPALDIGGGVMSQLQALGVEAVDLAETDSVCTIEDDRFYSYRRQGQASGRLGALVRCDP